MIVKVSDMVKAVRVAIDMNKGDKQLLLDNDEDTLALDEIICQKIEVAARVIEQNAPVHMLDSGWSLSGSITFDKTVGIGRGRMKLPDNFMRLITFKMSDWKRAVVTPIMETDPQYALQSSEFPGIKGNAERPVVAIISEPTGLVLEFWSCEGGNDVVLQRGRYLPFPKISDGNIEICEKFYWAVVYMAASMTAAGIGDIELGKSLSDQSEALMGL